MKKEGKADTPSAPRPVNRGGRPKASRREDIKNRVIQIALSEKDLEKVKEELRSIGTGMTVSSFLHKRLIEQVVTFKKVNVLGANTYLDMNKVGVNINQIAYHLNTGKYDVTQDLLMELKDLYQQHIDLIIETLKEGGN